MGFKLIKEMNETYGKLLITAIEMLGNIRKLEMLCYDKWTGNKTEIARSKLKEFLN